jgi:hypothetical protein
MACGDTKYEGMPLNALRNRLDDSSTQESFIGRRLTFELSPAAPFFWNSPPGDCGAVQRIKWIAGMAPITGV